jgi:hypothetical protein
VTSDRHCHAVGTVEWACERLSTHDGIGVWNLSTAWRLLPRGVLRVVARSAVVTLRRCRFRVRGQEDGLPEWKAAGLPTEVVP